MSEPFDRISDWAAQTARDYVEQWRDEYGPLTESPAELNFLLAWLALFQGYGWPIGVATSAEEASKLLYRHKGMTVIRPQAQISTYRVDFVVTHHLLGSGEDDPQTEASVVIECDGHDFHERTKEQASRDKARDRRLQALGYQVFRFTGSDLYQRPIECAEEVLNLLADLSWPRRRRPQS